MRLKPKQIRSSPPSPKPTEMKWADGPPTREGHYVLEWIEVDLPVWTFHYCEEDEIQKGIIDTGEEQIDLGTVVKHLEIIAD